jgi:HSP20 family protein
LNSIDHGSYYEVQVFAIGFAKENIKLSVVEDVLYISGTKELPESGAPTFSRQEFPIKSFERMLNLQGQVDIASISAKQENGVLIITLPKSKEAQTPAQEIQVN